MINKLTLTIICFFANFIIAGFACQFGMLIKPIAYYFHKNIHQVIPIFALLHVGAFIGTMIAYFLIEKIGLKRIAILCYCLILSSCFTLYFTHNFNLAALCLTLVGISGGVSLCIAGTLLVALWQGRIQATLLVMQDLVFNSAGVLFPLLTTYALTHQLRWSFSYFLAALLCIIVIGLLVTSRFEVKGLPLNPQRTHRLSEKMEWNYRIILGGAMLFISMLALYTFLTWLPLFISHKFSQSFIKTGTLITQYWGATIIGALLCSLLATRIPIRVLLLCSIGVATLASYQLFTTNKLHYILPLVWLYGITCSAPYNIFIAYALSFTAKPTSKIVSFILFAGAIGCMLSPLITPWFELQYGLNTTVLMVPLLYAVVFVLILISSVNIQKLKQIIQKHLSFY